MEDFNAQAEQIWLDVESMRKIPRFSHISTDRGVRYHMKKIRQKNGKNNKSVITLMMVSVYLDMPTKILLQFFKKK